MGVLESLSRDMLLSESEILPLRDMAKLQQTCRAAFAFISHVKTWSSAKGRVCDLNVFLAATFGKHGSPGEWVTSLAGRQIVDLRCQSDFGRVIAITRNHLGSSLLVSSFLYLFFLIILLISPLLLLLQELVKYLTSQIEFDFYYKVIKSLFVSL